MVAKQVDGSGAGQHGVTPWYVPLGAAFDRNIEHGNMHMPARLRWRRGKGKGYINGGNTGAWDDRVSQPLPLDLEDFGLDEYEDVIHWDEVEDFNHTSSDWITPRRPTIHNVEGLFERAHIERDVPHQLEVGAIKHYLTQAQWAKRMETLRLEREWLEQRAATELMVRLTRIAVLCKFNAAVQLNVLQQIRPKP